MFKKPSHKYPTNFSHNNFNLKKCSLNCTKYSISFRGPKLWNEFLTPANLKFCRNYYIKSIWIFKYALEQSFGALVRGCFWEFVRWICGTAPALASDFNKAARRLCWGRTSAWVFSCWSVYIYIYIYIFPSTHLAHYMCVLKH